MHLICSPDVCVCECVCVWSFVCLPTCNVIRWCLNNLVHVPSWCAAGKDAGVFINDTTEERFEPILSSSHSAGFEFLEKL